MADESSTTTLPSSQGFGSGVSQNFENCGSGSPVLPVSTVTPIPTIPPKKCYAGNRFQLTLNKDPTVVFPDVRKYLEKFGAFNYMVAAIEKAPKTGHEHMHIFVQYNRTVKLYVRFLQGAHVEKCYGSTPQNIDYVKKDGNVIYEKGNPKVPQHKIDEVWDQFIEDIHNGEVDKDSKMYARFHGYARERLLELEKHTVYEGKLDIKNYWIHGPTGCGKSSFVRKLFPTNEIYNKQLNKWWDGYNKQQCVLLEDIDPDRAKILVHHLKIWADRYPFLAEQKGSTVELDAGNFMLIITSQYSIEECFSDPKTERDGDALKRRFTEVEMPFEE